MLFRSVVPGQDLGGDELAGIAAEPEAGAEELPAPDADIDAEMDANVGPAASLGRGRR